MQVENYDSLIFEYLPHNVCCLLIFIIDLLSDVTNYSDVNKMVTQNLAVCVAPNLYRDGETDPMKVIHTQDVLRGFVTTGIKWAILMKST